MEQPNFQKGERGKMNYSDSTFIQDLRDGLRCGMTEALRLYKSLSSVDVSGVERTLYPTIREYTVKYLDAIGYHYLVSNPSFFVIGETTIAGTSKKADGFICDIEIGKPLYVIEIGISNTDKFWDDYRKCVDEWSRTGILGAFILFFDSNGSDEKVNRLDGSVLRTPKNENFEIYPLVLPTNPNFYNAFESITCFRYFERHSDLLFNMITLSDRTNKGVIGKAERWTSDVIAPLLEDRRKFLVNKIINTEAIDFTTLDNALKLKPEVIVLQGGINPFRKFDKDMRNAFDSYIESKKPKIIIFSDWIESDEWETDATMNSLLPVEFIGKNHKDGQWDYFNNPLHFGNQIIPVSNKTMDLHGLINIDYFITGFTKTKIKPSKDIISVVNVKLDDAEYPFIVVNKSNNVTFVASGTGGWGQNWYDKYSDGYRLLWEKIIF